MVHLTKEECPVFNRKGRGGGGKADYEPNFCYNVSIVYVMLKY